MKSGVTDASTATRFLELLGAMKRYVRDNLPPFPDRGMSEEKFRTLLSLKLLGRSPLKSLAAHDRLSPSAQCIMLDRLVEEGFAARFPDSFDRRRVLYELSDIGLEELDLEIRRRSEILNSQLERLGVAERKRFATSVETLLKSLTKMSNAPVGAPESRGENEWQQR